jgi:hypothetical protein
MVWLQLMVPNLAQLRGYLTDHDTMGLDLPHFARDFGGHLWAGEPWALAEEHGDLYAELADFAARHETSFAVLLGLTAALVTGGALRMLSGGGVRPLVGLVLLLPAPLTLLQALVHDDYLYPWYLVFALPSAAAFWALGAAPARPRELLRPRGAAGALVLVVYLGLYVWLSQAPRDVLRHGPLQPIRESVALTRPDPDFLSEANDRIVTVGFQTPPLYYDPRVRLVQHPDELRRWMRHADKTRRELYVNLGRPRLAQARYGPLVELLEKDPRLELVAALHGTDPRGERRVYRYRGAP